jgi:hypothetical protein
MKQIMKTALKIFTRLLALAIVLYAGMFVILSFYNSPVYAWRILTLFSSDTQDYKVFPSRQIDTDGADFAD